MKPKAISLDEPRDRWAFLIASSAYCPPTIERLHDKIVLAFAKEAGHGEDDLLAAAAELSGRMKEVIA